MNKSDLAGGDIELVINAVKKINPFAVVERSSFARIGFEGKKNPFVQGIFEDYTVKEVEWFAGSTELVGIGRFSKTKTTQEHSRNIVANDQTV